MAAHKIKTIARDGRDAFQNVTDHLKTMVDHLGRDAGDAASVSAVALGHAAIELVGDVQTKLDRLERAAKREVRRHPAEALAATAASSALVAAIAAGLITYTLVRRGQDA
jgi:4-aminobutyrate aminotransferase-like enzyme